MEGGGYLRMRAMTSLSSQRRGVAERKSALGQGDLPDAACLGVTHQRGFQGGPVALQHGMWVTKNSESTPDVLAGGPGKGPPQARECGRNYSSVFVPLRLSQPCLWVATATSHCVLAPLEVQTLSQNPHSSQQRTGKRFPVGAGECRGECGEKRLRKGLLRFRDKPTPAPHQPPTPPPPPGPAERRMCNQHPAHHSREVSYGNSCLRSQTGLETTDVEILPVSSTCAGGGATGSQTRPEAKLTP